MRILLACFSNIMEKLLTPVNHIVIRIVPSIVLYPRSNKTTSIWMIELIGIVENCNTMKCHY